MGSEPYRAKPLRVVVSTWLIWIAVVGWPGAVFAQELVGRRLFADQLVIAEPFVEDELSLPSVFHTRLTGNQLTFPAIARLRQSPPGTKPAALVTQIDGELKKRITRNLEGSITAGLTLLDFDDHSASGLSNLELGIKYQFFRSPAREAVGSVAVQWEIGGTGRPLTGAESFDTISPAILFGKGLGDLPDALEALKPFALSLMLGARIPTRATTGAITGEELNAERHPNLLTWGVIAEYSVPYLQSYVSNLGLPMPLDRLIPLVELDFQTALDRGAAGKTFGTANVGMVWVGTAGLQLGVEAVLPVNERSGKNLGVRAFLRMGLDEIFDGRLGRPLFGGD